MWCITPHWRARFTRLGTFGLCWKVHDRGPSIIILDEPCSGLDVGTTLIIRSVIQRLAAGGRIRRSIRAGSTRPYVAGRSQFHLLWAFYLSAFLIYTYSAAAMELTLFGPDPALLFTESGIIAAVGLALWAARKAKVRGWDDVPFEADLPDQTFSGFNLTEIYAAQSVSTAQLREDGAANSNPRGSARID